MNEEQKQMIVTAIDTHIRFLYRESEAYKKNGNKESMIDCLEEVKKYRALKESLKEKPLNTHEL